MSHFCWWNYEILRPIANYGVNESLGWTAYRKLDRLLERILLRRTKIAKASDLGLPPRTVRIRRDWFSEDEEDFYQSLYSDSVRRFNTYVEDGTVLNNYAHIFELLTHMRQAVNHPDLMRSVRKGEISLVCVICNYEPEDPIISKCKHIFCREDARDLFDTAIEAADVRCPYCFQKLSIDLNQPAYQPAAGKQESRKSIINEIDMTKWRSSTKIEALTEELSLLRRRDSTIKSIVFSQYVNFLDLVHWRLRRAGFKCCRLDGRMTPQARDTVIKSFMSEADITVFLISLKAGGVALNLTEASNVFICDPWWNPAVENQAMDRIHRLGQHRPVRITRLVVENSIESRIIQLQDKKKALFDSTIGKDAKALARLSEEDLQFLFVL